MKKLLLCSTALAGLVAGSAIAEDKAMTVTVGGTSVFEAGYVSQSRTYKDYFSFSPNQKTQAFWSTAKAYIKAEGKTAEGLVYGAVMRIQTVANSANGVGDTRNDRSHIYLDTNFGSIQLGSNAAASKLMQVNAGTIAVATGGVDGDWNLYVNPNNARNADNSNASSLMFSGLDLLSNSSNVDGKPESARRISYFSPRFNGLQVGLSYASDLSNSGSENLLSSDNNYTTGLKSVSAATTVNGIIDLTTLTQEGTLGFSGSTNANISDVYAMPTMYFGTVPRVKNAYSIALNYMNNFNDVDVAFAATYDGGSTPTSYGVSDGSNSVSASINKMKVWSVGGSVGYKGISFAAHYGNNGKSLTAKSMYASNGTNSVLANFSGFKSTFWDAALAYENGPLGVSFSYLAGKNKMGTVSVSKNGAAAVNQTLPTVKTTVMSLGAEYQVAPGLKTFAEVTAVKVKPTNSTYTTMAGNTVTYNSDNNKATVFMLGTQIKF